MVNVHKYGNTSAGTVRGTDRSPGRRTASFGAGLTWGAGLVKWGERVEPLENKHRPLLPPCDKTALEILEPQIKRYLAHRTLVGAPEASVPCCDPLYV